MQRKTFKVLPSCSWLPNPKLISLLCFGRLISITGRLIDVKALSFHNVERNILDSYMLLARLDTCLRVSSIDEVVLCRFKLREQVNKIIFVKKLF